MEGGYFKAVVCKHHYNKARIEATSPCTAPRRQDSHLGDIFCPTKTTNDATVSKV